MSIRNKIAKTVIGIGTTSLIYFLGHGAISGAYSLDKLEHPEDYKSTPNSLVRMIKIEKELNKEIKIIEVNQSLVDKVNKLKEERFNLEISKDYQRDKSIYTENVNITGEYIMKKDILMAAGFGLLPILIGMSFYKKED